MRESLSRLSVPVPKQRDHQRADEEVLGELPGRRRDEPEADRIAEQRAVRPQIGEFMPVPPAPERPPNLDILHQPSLHDAHQVRLPGGAEPPQPMRKRWRSPASERFGGVSSENGGKAGVIAGKFRAST